MITNKATIINAEIYCETHGHRLTEPRQHVLKIVASSNGPITAYEILDKLGQVIDKPKPPTVYRAISFWQEHNFIHRIESLNAYVICNAGHAHAGSQFLICKDCGAVKEAHLCSMPSALEKKVTEMGFTQTYWNMEIHGMCAQCSKG